MGQVPFRRGDATCDGCIDCRDVEAILLYLRGNGELCCSSAADVNDDGHIDNEDAILLLEVANQGGAALPPPFPECGPDPTADQLECLKYPREVCESPLRKCASPTVEIVGPAQALWLGAPLELVYDVGSTSGFDGRSPRRFLWSATEGAQPLSPTSSRTVVRFPIPGEYLLQLSITGSSELPLPGLPPGIPCGVARQTITIVDPASLPPSRPLFAPRAQQAFVTVAGRRLRALIPLLEGSPPPRFRLLDGQGRPALPRLLQIDPLTGLLVWQTQIEDVGAHPLLVEASNDLGSDFAPITLVVLDPGHTGASYHPREAAGGGGPPEAGGGADGGKSVGDGGGGGVVGPAPASIVDESPLPPPLTLYLDVPSGQECAVLLVTPPDGPSALRFDPTCAGGAGPAFGGLYASSSSADKLTEATADAFTIEVWIANVPSAQLGTQASPALISSVSDVAGAINWSIGAAGNQEFIASINTSAGLLRSTWTGVDASGDTPRQLVFVREGTASRAYLDGALVSSKTEGGDLSVWSTSLPLLLGSSQDRTRPFTGDLLHAAFYPSALPDALIAYLFTVGPEIEDPDTIPGPIAEICPDPREIGRGELEVDGFATVPGLPIGGGGGAGKGAEAGGGAGGDVCTVLRPFIWQFAAPTSSWIWGQSPGATLDACDRDRKVAYDPDQTFLLDVLLEVRQIPVRDIERASTDEMTVPIPLMRQRPFQRGDTNTDGVRDLSDGVRSLLFFFSGASQPPCIDAGDTNDDGVYDLSDAVSLFGYLFLGTSAPPEPGDACGGDPTLDALECISYEPCE